MKPRLMLFMLVAAMLFTAAAYSQSSEGKVEYHKGDVTAAMLQLPYSPDVTEDAIKDYFDKMKTREDRYKGFDIFRNAKLKGDDKELCDIHCKVEKKKSKDGNSSVVYLLIGRPGENVSVRTADDRYRINEAKTLLNNLAPAIEAYNLEQQIKKQEDLVKKAERKLNALDDDRTDLENRIRNLQGKLADTQQKLEDTKNEQKKQAAATADLKTTLATLKGRRKS